jgi:hypothetical protein
MSKGIESDLMLSLNEFVDAIERTSNLTIICEENKDGKDILVVENSDVNKKSEGHQCEVELAEIFAKVKDCRSAQEFVDVINMDRKAYVLEGVTRIVGYYSRTHNWNKSKVGELRDRHKGGSYTSPGHVNKHDESTLATIDKLG